LEFVHFDIDESLRETTAHGRVDFPVAVYLQKVSKNAQGFVILHWHEEFQFVIQQVGSTVYKVNGQEMVLAPGDILFINSCCLHTARAVEENACYICVDVHPRMICGYGNNLMQQKYVQPLITADRLQYLLLRGDKPWEQAVRQELAELVATYEARAYGYELRTQAHLLSIWAALLENNRELLRSPAAVPPAAQARMTKMTDFINRHYMEDITLREIASAANISDGECCRFFRRMTSLSPIIYLTHFRITKSAALLASTDMSILSVAMQCGFASNSYYTERFREFMNCTPTEYRRRFSARQ